jgi:hypothetical protein
LTFDLGNSNACDQASKVVGLRDGAFHVEWLLKTHCGYRGFTTGRSKAVTELCKSNVGYVAMISTIAAPGHRRSLAGVPRKHSID